MAIEGNRKSGLNLWTMRKRMSASRACFVWVLVGCAGTAALRAADRISFEVQRAAELNRTSPEGRLFVILSRTNAPEPRMTLGQSGRTAPQALARDVRGFTPGTKAVLDRNAFTYPQPQLADLPADDYYVQALFAANRDLNFPNAPGNLYGEPQKVRVDPAGGGVMKLELTRETPAEQLPADSSQVKFVKLHSRLLSDFHHRPMYLRAGIILPERYESDTQRRYPLWVRIGGLNTRFTVAERLMSGDSDFRKLWNAAKTPRFILLQLDGAGPYGDPYYVNSANNGPFGDALVQELIPYVEKQFRASGESHGRVLSGVSTGGWVALALQIFYPDDFNGAWSACPDPVDFRAFELVNIYEDTNAYSNRKGYARPSERDVNGDVTLTMRDEVGAENLLGRGNSFALSGQQWGAWNAVYSPRGADGLPLPLWDPLSGEIDRRVAAQWRKYDLRSVLEQNWQNLAPKLNGKLHIAAGEADQYFLNNAVHLLEAFFNHADPPFQGRIVYGPRKRHGWSDVDLPQMLQEMAEATR